MVDHYWNIVNIAILVYGLSICLLSKYYKPVSFGWGLGDLIWHILMYLSVILHICIYLIALDRSSKSTSIIAIGFAVVWILFSLKATLFRGDEYKWNGKLFYEHPSEVKLNQIDQKGIQAMIDAKIDTKGDNL